MSSTEHPGATAGDQVRRITSGGRTRTYLLHLPPGSAPDRPAPLLLMFHPALATGRWFADLTGMSAAADPDGYVVAYPDGYRRTWNAGNCCGPAHRDGVDDVGFARDVIDDVSGIVRVDPARTYAAGFSNGGAMAYRLACEMADRFAAITVASAAFHVDPAACRPSRPVSVLHFHGRADPIAPYAGGPGAVEQTGPQVPVETTIATWVRLNGCVAQPRTELHRGQATLRTYPGCRGGTAVSLCVIENMGHQWPGARQAGRDAAGPTTQDVAATPMALEFFRAHHR